MRPAHRQLLVGAALSLTAFLLVAALVELGPLEPWDRAILRWAEALGPRAWRAAAFATSLGSVLVLTLVTVGVALWAYLRGRRVGASVLVLGALVAHGATVLLKLLFARARPDYFAPDFFEKSLPLSHAFPSGHSLVPLVIYPMAAWLVASLRPSWGRMALRLAIAFALVSGLSRVALGVHWPTDVLGGFAGGVSLALLGRIALDLAAARDRKNCESAAEDRP